MCIYIYIYTQKRRDFIFKGFNYTSSAIAVLELFPNVKDAIRM